MKFSAARAYRGVPLSRTVWRALARALRSVSFRGSVYRRTRRRAGGLCHRWRVLRAHTRIHYTHIYTPPESAPCVFAPLFAYKQCERERERARRSRRPRRGVCSRRFLFGPCARFLRRRSLARLRPRRSIPRRENAFYANNRGKKAGSAEGGEKNINSGCSSGRVWIKPTSRDRLKIRVSPGNVE